MAKGRFLIFLFFIFCLPSLNAQRLITGKVLDVNTKERLDSVDVAVYKGTTVTTTNEYGYFQLTVKDGDSLLITHPEYTLGLISIPETDVFHIYLEKLYNSPVYLEGENRLSSFLSNNLLYPSSARLKKIEGLVIIKLQINKDGNMTQCEVLNDIGGNCAKEALNVFLKIPGKWSKSTESRRMIFPVVYRTGESNTELKIPDVDISGGKVMDAVYVIDY